MKQKLLKRTLLLLCAIIVGGGDLWAEDEVAYTLTPALGSNNGYANNCDITISGITWNLTGNSTFQPWRIGGKSLMDVDRTLYSKTAISDDITKIDVKHGAASSITVNSWTLIVSKNSDFSSPVSTLTPAFTASTTTTIMRPDGVDWSNCYFKFVYNVSVSGSSNKYIEFSEAKFYKATAPTTYSVTYDGNDATSGSVPTDAKEYKDGDNTVTVLGNTGNLAKTGYTFSGWNTKNDGTGTNYSAGSTFSITDNTTLYAKWDLVATALSVKTAPTKVDYKIGETLDLTGLVLSATVGGTPTDVTSGYTATIGEDAVTSGTTVLNSAGDQTITFTYGGQTATQTITVGTISSLTYNSTGDGAFANTTYTENDHFDPTGLVVTAHYTNGISEVVDGYTLSPSTSDELATSNTAVTVSYTWAGTQQTVNIPITVSAGTKYTVSFNAGNGTYTGGNITETQYQGGVTLPSPTSVPTDWTFYGWTTSLQTTETTTAPKVTAAGATYYPTGNVTLYAVYSITENEQFVVSGTDLTGTNTATQLDSNHPVTYKISSSNSYSNPLRVYQNSILTIAGASISKIVLTMNGNYSASKLSLQNGSDGSYSSGTWTGTSTSVALKASEQVRIDAIQVTYTASSTTYTSLPAPKAELSFSVAEYSGVWGRSFTNPTLTNTNDVTVSYESSNIDVATVNAETGEVTIVGVGSAVITASFVGNASYRANQASYTLNTCYGTIAQIKELTSSTTAVNFTADLEDAVVTYVNGDYAYLQDASAAVMVNFADHGMTAGKKINGGVTGTVKANNQIDVFTAFDFSAATESDADVPAATVATLATIKSSGTAYDGKLVTVNGGAVTGSIATTESSGASIKDGSQIESTDVSFNLYAPNKGIAVNSTEQGIFTGFVSIYNGSTYRLNIYEQSQISITRNAPTDQPMSFATAAYDLSEETDAYTAFAGQTVTGNKGTVTYSIEADDDASGVVSSINSTTGEVELSGNYGTATITATAAATEETVEGVTTPYNQTVKTYTITVGPRYSVTFYANGTPTSSL